MLCLQIQDATPRLLETPSQSSSTTKRPSDFLANPIRIAPPHSRPRRISQHPARQVASEAGYGGGHEDVYGGGHEDRVPHSDQQATNNNVSPLSDMGHDVQGGRGVSQHVSIHPSWKATSQRGHFVVRHGQWTVIRE